MISGPVRLLLADPAARVAELHLAPIEVEHVERHRALVLALWPRGVSPPTISPRRPERFRL